MSAYYPDPAQLVQQSKIYGSVNPGNLYQSIKRAAGGNVNRYVYIRNSVQSFITSSNARDIDSIYVADKPFAASGNPPVVNNVSVVAPIGTTPTDSDGLIFPRSDADVSTLDSFYRSAAYQDYVGKRMAQTAGPGSDPIFNNYVLNGVLSYEANNNLAGAIGYMNTIAEFKRAEATASVRQSALAKGVDLTSYEASLVMSGVSITMVRSPANPNIAISLERFVNGTDIVVNAPQSVPTFNSATLGILSLLSSGIFLMPLPEVTSAPTPSSFEDKAFRSFGTGEWEGLLRIFGESARSTASKTLLAFGSMGNRAAEIAFSKGHPAITLGHTIYFNRNPGPMTSATDLASLAHEFRHVVVNELMGTIVAAATIGAQAALYGSDRAYNYWTRSNSFGGETLEGQAQIVQDYVIFRETATLPNPQTHGGVVITQAMMENWAIGSGVYGK